MKIRVAFLTILLCPTFVGAENLPPLRNSELEILDGRIERLERERDQKLDVLKKCEQETRGFKIAGITTLAATGVGIYANIKLNETRKKLSAGGGSGGGIVRDMRPQETKNNESCELLCSLGIAPPDCGC